MIFLDLLQIYIIGGRLRGGEHATAGVINLFEIGISISWDSIKLVYSIPLTFYTCDTQE